MLEAGSKAVVLDTEGKCCGGFETGTVVKIVSVGFDKPNVCYECKSLSPELPHHGITLWHCDGCLVPIVDKVEE